MRIRIALGAAMAATFVISSTSIITPAGAATRPAARPSGQLLDRGLVPADVTRTSAALETAGNLWPADGGSGRGLGYSLGLAAVHGVTSAAHTATAAVGTAPAPAPVPLPPTPPPDTDAASTATGTWACIRTHESGDRYNSPTAPSGAYGILDSTWLSLGYSGWPYEAAATVQDAAALTLYHEYGWQPWSTRVVCGL